MEKQNLYVLTRDGQKKRCTCPRCGGEDLKKIRFVPNIGLVEVWLGIFLVIGLAYVTYEGLLAVAENIIPQESLSTAKVISKFIAVIVSIAEVIYALSTYNNFRIKRLFQSKVIHALCEDCVLPTAIVIPADAELVQEEDSSEDEDEDYGRIDFNEIFRKSYAECLAAEESSVL